VTGVRGQWVTMSGLDDCTVAGLADAHVMGWATRANFSVDSPCQQVANGWGPMNGATLLGTDVLV